MRTLAIYYIDPVEGRQKFVVFNPTDAVVEHYLWIIEHIQAVPDGHSVGIFEARMEIPLRTTVRPVWLLDRSGIRTIRVEEIDQPETLWKDAA